MSVFISHRKTDGVIAESVAQILKSHRIETYLDVLDPALNNQKHITEKILNGLRRSSHLLAIISDNTQGSWWVPFEIGVATEGDKRIATYSTVPISSLPDYLKMWPVLIQYAQISMFAMRYLSDRLILEKAYKYTEAGKTTVQSAADFHRLLKSDIGQK